MIDRVRALRHDLGKYVALQITSLPPDPTTEDLAEAVRADVLATRRGPDRTVAAVELWDAASPALRAALADNPSFLLLDQAMEGLRRLGPAITADRPDRRDLEQAASCARAAADAVRALDRSVRR
ncbi:MAG: hypothetical protein ABMA64_10450 [Myxococcota bacterium]